MLLAELLAVSPTPNPLLVQPKITAPILTIDPFYDAKKQTGSMITLTGTSDPDAELDISITPDIIKTTIAADVVGNWTYVHPTKLTNGSKQLTITARSPSGGQTSKTETFIVAGGSQFPLVAVILSILIAGGVGGYFLYRKMKAKKTPPPDQYVSTTPASFIPPDPTPTEKPPLPL
jgi:hypothetical protein